MSLCFPLAGKGRRFFPGILISPRLIKIAIASRMSSSSLRLFREGFSIEDFYGIPRTTLRELRKTKFPKNMESSLLAGNHRKIQQFIDPPGILSMISSSRRVLALGILTYISEAAIVLRSRLQNGCALFAEPWRGQNRALKAPEALHQNSLANALSKGFMNIQSDRRTRVLLKHLAALGDTPRAAYYLRDACHGESHRYSQCHTKLQQL